MRRVQIRYGFLFGTVILLLSFMTILGQEYRGTITGNVTDPNGAIIPGATVTVQNIETRQSTAFKLKIRRLKMSPKELSRRI